MKTYKKLCAVPGWMFGKDLTVSNITENDNGTVTVIYPCSIGWMAKNTTKELSYNSLQEFKEYNDIHITAVYCSKFLNRDQIRELNYMQSLKNANLKEIVQKSFEYAKLGIKLKYEINLFNHR